MYALLGRLAHDRHRPRPARPQAVRKAEEVDGSGRGRALVPQGGPEGNPPRLLRGDFQAELGQARRQCGRKPRGVLGPFKQDEEVIGLAHQFRRPPQPRPDRPVEPEVEDVMPIHVRQHR